MTLKEYKENKVCAADAILNILQKIDDCELYEEDIIRLSVALSRLAEPNVKQAELLELKLIENEMK